MTKPDTATILAGLKDFQRDTVEHVFRRLYLDTDSVRRFLVADEVGLGKTLVARGVIAKTIDYLWDRTKRIDIIYVCSNADIARQNINRLNVIGCKEFALTSRITLLPITITELNAQQVNFISFTPSTSFDLKRSGGIARERALLYWLLKEPWSLDSRLASRPFEATAKRNGFQWELDQIDPASIHPEMQAHFVEALQKRPDLRDTYDELLRRVPPRKDLLPHELRLDCLPWIGELRRVLAGTCLRWLEPDLIILDEFQRFKHLLNTDSDSVTDAAELAEHLFNFQLCEHDEATAARVLLLSATPYKMFTTHAESADDDHYADFHTTLKFLVSDPDQRDEFQRIIARYRNELFSIGDRGTSQLMAIKAELEEALRGVMVRTERLAIGADRNGMLTNKPMPGVRLTESDVQQFLALQQIASRIGHGDMLDYWKSSPYLLNFMEEYDVKRKLADAVASQVDGGLAKAMRSLGDGMLDRETIEKYGRIDPGNARLRSLAQDTVDRGAWRLLWVPPALPYYVGTGPYADPDLAGFTKRLVFSCWKVVPKAIASVLSYEAEREMMRTFRRKAPNTADARKKRRGLLRFTFSKGRPTGMPVLGMLYPCQTLASEIDPLEMRRSGMVAFAEAVVIAEQKVRELLRRIIQGHDHSEQAVDESWYWAAPLLMDLQHGSEATRRWVADEALATTWSGDALSGDGEAAEGWVRHVEVFRGLLDGTTTLGKPPEDLTRVLAFSALASPGVVSLRALNRVIPPDTSGGRGSFEIRNYAAPLAHAFLHLFNLPEVMYLIRDRKRETPYWQSVLEYSAGGNLQSMLDEYLHQLVESLGLVGQSRDKYGKEIVSEVAGALLLRTSTAQADLYRAEGRCVQVAEPIRLRNRFAMRFGDQTYDDATVKTRPGQVRSAFNSPFWPFVLASTSVGQEGLDFHPYCHAVVHWNLPTNPVDLEQREGRVHRYKGHALRKNIASRFSEAAVSGGHSDPWEAMFCRAKAERNSDHNDLYPFWLSPDGVAKIERHIPLLPHSREVAQQERLQRSLVLYRMVFGQNRQEDLVAYLQDQLTPAQIAELVDSCRIDLSPPRTIPADRSGISPDG